MAQVRRLGLIFALSPVLPAAASAPSQTPFPEFTGERLYVAGVGNVYEALREEIARIEGSSAQTYYVVVVSSSGSGPWATRDYIDGMYQVWLQQAARKRLPLNADRAVIIVLAVENRELSVHAGTLLQERYGLRGETIDREMVRPHFIPHAKAGNYQEGLKVLWACWLRPTTPRPI